MAENSGVDSSSKNVNKLASMAELHSSIVPSSLQVINPKLTRDNYRHNYRFWRSQVLFTVGAHGLEEHLTGLIPCLEPLLTWPIDVST